MSVAILSKRDLNRIKTLALSKNREYSSKSRTSHIPILSSQPRGSNNQTIISKKSIIVPHKLAKSLSRTANINKYSQKSKIPHLKPKNKNPPKQKSSQIYSDDDKDDNDFLNENNGKKHHSTNNLESVSSNQSNVSNDYSENGNKHSKSGHNNNFDENEEMIDDVQSYDNIYDKVEGENEEDPIVVLEKRKKNLSKIENKKVYVKLNPKNERAQRISQIRNEIDTLRAQRQKELAEIQTKIISQKASRQMRDDLIKNDISDINELIGELARCEQEIYSPNF
ncbi:hypothetical protein TRFO_22966 [Tritrichomonas foetus]|uniref:Uncharacterized protein n=1 Tax=Tritrichomonas foetus TaxID=1144522 RepID=A0A1J4KBD1_9EUKA|nr:hypothetical protein TRFO_22966 [Tritrichomonas foetus]|eukprot:OHT08531.1 hypothetical protein TRFO_22966 [Tritrichomonas foetus]